MTIKMKILIPMIVLIIITTATILFVNIMIFSNYVDKGLSQEVALGSDVASDKIEVFKTQARIGSLLMAADATIQRALADGNRDLLLSRSKELLAEIGADFCTIGNASGIAVARPHKPETYGDDISAMPSVKIAMSGKRLTYIEPGVSVRMSVGAATPVYDSRGTFLGAIVIGFNLDNNTFVDSIKSLVGSEISIFTGDERTSTTIVKEDGTRITGTKEAENISTKVLAGEPFFDKVNVLGSSAFAKYTPIIGPDSKPIGMLFVGRYTEERDKTVSTFIWTGILIMLILLGIAIATIIFVVRRIVSPIHSMVKTSRDLAMGDTDVYVQVNTQDEMLELAKAFNTMIESTRKITDVIEIIGEGNYNVDVQVRSDRDSMSKGLLKMITETNKVLLSIAEVSDHVASDSLQISEGSQALAQGTTEQASAIEELSSTIANINNMTLDIRNNAQNGNKQMSEMVAAVEAINEASADISKVIKVIDDIAFQTNILALNAAVEAAHAGQHGKGFAVVAEEVRNLASKSAEAAKNTSAMIAESIQKAQAGMDLARATQDGLSVIVSQVDEAATAIDQVNVGIEQISQVVQNNSATAEESAASSQELSAQANTLKELVAKFNLKHNI